MSVRVAILEDDPQVAQRLAELLGQTQQHRLVWLATDLQKARARLAETFDVLLLDLGLPDGRGTELIPLVRSAAPQARIVAFTVFDDETHVLEAIEAGVDGYALKNCSSEQLIEVLDGVMRGESPISSAVAGYLLKRLRRTERSNASPGHEQSRGAGLMELTPRERDVLEMLARGLSYRETGQALGIGSSTVAHHVRSLYPKLAANSRSEAVFNAVRDGVIRL
jgi:DNA-binding NarL/FixJ family response regulator